MSTGGEPAATGGVDGPEEIPVTVVTDGVCAPGPFCGLACTLGLFLPLGSGLLLLPPAGGEPPVPSPCIILSA
jgi:hypothetical protein